MATAEQHLRRLLAAVIHELKTAFPTLQAPDPSWIMIWVQKYPLIDIQAAIQTLSQHPPQVQARYTTESVGRAITALLRERTIRRVIESATKSATREDAFNQSGSLPSDVAPNGERR